MFLLEMGEDYEGGRVIMIGSTYEKALFEAQAIMKRRNYSEWEIVKAGYNWHAGCDWLSIFECELDEIINSG